MQFSPRRSRRSGARLSRPFRVDDVLAVVVGTLQLGLALAAPVGRAALASLAGRPGYLLPGAAVVVGAAFVAMVAVQQRPADVRSAEVALTLDPPTGVVQELAAQELLPLAVDVPAESVPEAAPAAAETPAEPPKPRQHTVEEGESLRMLAAKYGVSTETIMWANDIPDPDLLRVGQELVILPSSGVLYSVKPGESLRRIAERFEVPIADIVAANSVGANPDVVQVGQELFIPGGRPRVEAPAAPAVAQAGEGQQQSAQIVPPVPLTEAVARRAVPSARSYQVQEGDTLRSIATTFGVDVDTLLSSNGIEDPDTIKPGVELRILPVKGIEYTVQPGETLADIAWTFQADLGILLDYNDLDNPDMLRVGTTLVIPGGRRRPDAASGPAARPEAPAPARPAAQEEAPAPASAPAPVARPAAPAAPAVVAPAPAPKPAPKPAAPAPAPVIRAAGGGGGAVVANALKFKGYPYVWGGTSPSGFDCTGFTYYVFKVSGIPVGRGMWQQYNAGTRVALDEIQPGDMLFWANTYMPGLSHNGIYIGNGQFIHAADESTGVTISNMNTQYWASRYVGAVRLWD